MLHNQQQQQLVQGLCVMFTTINIKAWSMPVWLWKPFVTVCAACCTSSACICIRALTRPLCKHRRQPCDLSRTAEVSINGALAPPHPCLSTPQTLPLSSLGPPDKLPPCLKVGHYRPPEHHRAPHRALIAISSSSSPVLHWRPGGGWRVPYSTVDSTMRLLSCLINAFYMYPSTCQLLPVLL